MKYLAWSVALVGLLVGCSSQETKEAPKPAPVVQPEPKAQAPSAPVAKPAAQQPTVQTDPFNDPSNPLSKRSIYYDFDQSLIKDEYKPIIEAHAAYLAAHAGAHIRVEGNCDERGSREYNLALGQRRADSVKAALKLLGAAGSQIETSSWGKEKPRAMGHDEAAWAQNRRSDIIYLKKR